MDTRASLIIIFTLLTICAIQSSAIMDYDVSSVCRSGLIKVIHVPSPIYNGWSSSGLLNLNYRVINNVCTVQLIPPRDAYLLLSIHELDVRAGCRDNLTVIYDGRSNSFYCSRINDYREINTVQSRSNMTIIFKSGDGFVTNLGFRLVYTAYVNALRCQGSELYLCDNGHCIADVLKCDGHNHCGDRSDQHNCAPSPGAVAGYSIGTIIIVIAVVSLVVCCVRRRRRTVSARVGRIIPTVHPVPNVHPPIRTAVPTVHSPIRTAMPSYQSQPPNIATIPDAPPPYQQVVTSYPTPATTYQPLHAGYQQQQTSPNYPQAYPPAYSEAQPAYNSDFKQ